MSTDELEDDGNERRRKKPPRLRADGKPDRRSPPKEHRFKKGQPSPNPDGARKHKPKSKSARTALSVEDLLATEILLPSGEMMTYGEVITLKQIKAASEGSTAAFKAIQAARARGGPPPEPESPGVVQERRRLALHLSELLAWGQNLKRSGLTGTGEYGLASWIHEEHERRMDEGLLPPTSDYLFRKKKEAFAAKEAEAKAKGAPDPSE